MIFSLVLCTAPDAHRALLRARRVLKPQGTIAVLEHVHSAGLLGKIQDRVAPVWHRLADGCSLNRNTLLLLDAVGFDISRIERHRVHGLIIEDLIVGFAALRRNIE
ncbi:MAG: hypothetical protein M3160_10520 [Candidatus Eremiobacteraeota bacterium]|nr:hypothetical protein [Candidatus Eremiobacteraeota bacterium]